MLLFEWRRELRRRGTSWLRERGCGRGGIRKNYGNLWKSKRRQIKDEYNVETLSTRGEEKIPTFREARKMGHPKLGPRT
jgi:hypothetical protein